MEKTVKDVREQITDIDQKRKDLTLSKRKLEEQEAKLLIEKSKLDHQTRLEKRKINIYAKKKVIDKYLQDYPESSHFVKQAKNFYINWDKYEEAKKDGLLDYKSEMELLSKVNFQYNRCINVLIMDIKSNTLVFRNELLAWQSMVEKRLNKLEKG